MLLFLSVLLFTLTGCSEERKADTKDVRTMGLEYMEQKYGEKFQYHSAYGDSISGTHEFLVTCESLPDQKVLVQIEKYKSEDRIFRDNYVAVKYRQQTIDFIKNLAIKEFGEAQVFYEVSMDGLSPELSANASFSEYLADTRVPLSFSIRTKASKFTSEKQAERLANSLAIYGTKYITVLASVVDEQYGTSSENLSFVWRVQLTRLNNNIEIDWLEKK